MPSSSGSVGRGGDAEPVAKLLTIDAVAELLGVSSRWLADECRAGRVAHVHIARKRRFTAMQIERLIESRSVQPEQPSEQPERRHPGVSDRVYRRLERQGVIPPRRPP
jgi:hypothetical protein